MRTTLICVPLSFVLLHCAGADELSSTGSMAQAVTAEQATMVVYRAGMPVPGTELTDLGPPEGLGGTVLEGDPRIAARVDYANGGELAGVFQATRGLIRVVFPFTEQATITFGEVTLTDETGQQATLRPGDSYIIEQGSVILWDVKGELVQKSFFNFNDPNAAAAPARAMRIYRRGEHVEQTELMDLGAPEALGGTVLEGDPAIAARVDYANGALMGGVFQATTGYISILFPFDEHAAVLNGVLTLADGAGRTEQLNPGDSYFIRQGSVILWDVDGPQLQKTFFNYTRP